MHHWDVSCNQKLAILRRFRHNRRLPHLNRQHARHGPPDHHGNICSTQQLWKRNLLEGPAKHMRRQQRYSHYNQLEQIGFVVQTAVFRSTPSSLGLGVLETLATEVEDIDRVWEEIFPRSSNSSRSMERNET